MAEESELRLYGEIGPAFFGMIDDVAVIRALDELKDARKIHVRLNSPGGDYFMGVSIANALKRHSAKVVVHVDALAASAASVIAMGGDRIVMHAGSLMMVHRAWSIASGNAADFAKVSETLNKVDEQLIELYKRTGLDKGKLRTMIDAETWMDSNEAVQLGFADEADAKETGAQAEAPKGWYAKAPKTVGIYETRKAAAVTGLTIAAKMQAPSEIDARRAQLETLKTRLLVA